MAAPKWEDQKTDKQRVAWLRERLDELALKMNRNAIDLEGYRNRLRELETTLKD